MNYKKNFVEINKKIASNNGLKNNLKDCLLDLKKDELKVYTDNYQIKGISKLKKSDLVDKIYEEVIINKKIIIPIESIEYSAFLTLETLIKEQTIDITNASVKEYIDLYSLAIAFPYIVEDKVMLVMPTEVATTFANVDLTKTKALLSVQREFKDYVKSFGQVYGAIELDMFVDYFNNATGDVITKENITSYFDSLNNNVEYMGIKDNMLVHEAILMYEGDLEKLLKERTNKGIKTYKELAKDDLLKYANDDYIEMSKDHEKFIELMTDLIEDENEAFDTLFELKTFFTCNEYNVNIVADILFKHIGEEKLKNQKVLETLVKTSFNIFENTRRWGNSGFTTAEIRPSKEPITSAKVAGRNEPCPCGSGKKYKKCCLNK